MTTTGVRERVPDNTKCGIVYPTKTAHSEATSGSMSGRSRPQQIPRRRRFESLPSVLFGGVPDARLGAWMRNAVTQHAYRE